MKQRQETMTRKSIHITIFLVLLSLYLVREYRRLTSCLASGNSQTIQQVIDRGVRQIKLCQGAHFDLTTPLTLKFKGQELTTIGYPIISSDKATLKLVTRDNSLAVNAYNVDGAKISHIRVDGNRRELGQLVSHALVLVGGNVSHQEVSNTELFDSRSWSHLHVNWGDFYRDQSGVLHSQCRGVTVKNNLIGPGGEASSLKWSDGISLQCENSHVIDNVITDVTDGGIVIFGAPGSIIQNNSIMADTLPLLVGIGLVDYAYEGNYQGIQVINNTISSPHSFIKAGIAMGVPTWDCMNKDKINYGAKVVGNQLSGSFGYGLAASGVKDWEVQSNTAQGEFVGYGSLDCQNHQNASPSAFVFDQNHSSGSFQKDFVPGHLESIHTLQR